MDGWGAHFRWPSRGLVCIGLVLAAVASSSLVWIGGELHYRNCLQRVELRYPVGYQLGEGNGYGWRFGSDSNTHFAFYKKAERDRALSSCSRLP